MALFNGKITEKEVLTTGHRTYGAGESHLHVGWDNTESRVGFTSHKPGNPNVCVGIVPEGWKGVGFPAAIPASP